MTPGCNGGHNQMTDNKQQDEIVDEAEVEVVEAEVVEVEGTVDGVSPEAAYAAEFGPPRLPAETEDPADALMRIVGNAVESAQPIEVIERLLAVHERLEANEARKL